MVRHCSRGTEDEGYLKVRARERRPALQNKSCHLQSNASLCLVSLTTGPNDSKLCQTIYVHLPWAHASAHRSAHKPGPIASCLTDGETEHRVPARDLTAGPATVRLSQSPSCTQKKVTSLLLHLSGKMKQYAYYLPQINYKNKPKIT